MLRLLLILALIAAAGAHELLGVKYSFDEDFSRTFNSKGCDAHDVWWLAKYDAFGVDPPFVDSDLGLLAAANSCATSFPIAFFQGTLEFNVFARVISKDYRLIIEVFDDHDVSIARYAYGRSSEGFTSGWSTISLKINEHTLGYVNIRGHRLNNEIVLIDSFQYIPNGTIINDTDNINITRENDLDNNDEDDEEIIFDFVSRSNLFGSDESEIGSGDDGSGIDPNPNPTTEAPEAIQETTFWTPVVISLAGFGVFIVLAITFVSVYHFGRLRGIVEPVDFIEDSEPSGTVTIPRVTGLYGGSYLSSF